MLRQQREEAKIEIKDDYTEKDCKEIRTETLMVLCGSAAHCEFAVNVACDKDLRKPNDERREILTSI